MLIFAPSSCAFITESIKTFTALSAFFSALPYNTGTRSTTPTPDPPFPSTFLYSSSTAFSPSSFVCPYRFVGAGSASASYGASPGLPGKT